MYNFNDIIENIKNEFISHRHLWLYRLCIFLDIILIAILVSYGVIPDNDYVYSTEILPVRYTVIFGLLILCIIPIHKRMFTPAEWKDYNCVRHLPRTNWLFFYFLILLFSITYILLQINIIWAAPYLDGLLEYHKIINELKRISFISQEYVKFGYYRYMEIQIVLKHLEANLLKNIEVLNEILSPEHIMKAQNLEDLEVKKILCKISQITHFILVVIFSFISLVLECILVYGVIITLFCLNIFFDTIFGEFFGFFFYSLIYFGDFTTTSLMIFIIIFIWNWSTFRHDVGFEHTYPVYVLSYQKDKDGSLQYVEHLSRDHFLFFNCDGKKWPEKSNMDYTFYDIKRKRLIPLNSSKFQLFIGDLKNNCRIDSSQFQIYENCIPVYKDTLDDHKWSKMTRERIPRVEYNVYNAAGSPYPFINNTAYTLYSLDNELLDISKYHIFDMKGNKLEYSYFCSSWKETGITSRPMWTIDRKEHYIFDSACRLCDNNDVRLRYYNKNNKIWSFKDPVERN